MNRIVQFLLLANTISRDSIAKSAIIENSVVGEPVVECGMDGIGVDVITVHSFLGRLYVQGESDDPNCVVSYHGGDQQSYALEGTDDNQQLRFSLKFGECNMLRQRTLNPRGVAYTFTLIVSFHPIFETEVDRAYRVRCFFTESVKALEATLGVSQLTTHIIEQEFILPTCMYEIRESRDGPFVKFAHIGEHIWHVWHCDLVAGMVYGMLIHSCHVDDGQGKQVPVVDNKGCVLDPLLLSNIEYDDQAITAYAETHVFKYSDKIQLYFTCTVQLCVKNDGGCIDVTPPVCEDTEYLPQSLIEYSQSNPDQHDDPSHFRQQYESEKEFFGPIDAARKEVDKNLPSTSSPPLTESRHLKTTVMPPRKLRARRGINADNNLKQSQKIPLEVEEIAETDLTAHVVVFPMIGDQSSETSSTNNKGKLGTSCFQRIVEKIHRESKLGKFILLLCLIFINLAVKVESRSRVKYKQLTVMLVMDDGTLKEKTVQCP
uniref:ZP domain-containing protein n=1 Tax=Setaria digitata TaxID=48799 RepID=A0A915PVI7_9BILA